MMMMMTKLILATVCCLVLVPLQCEALSIEEHVVQHDGELEDLRAIVRALQGQIEEMKHEKGGRYLFEVRQNDTSDLEARVTVLEESVSDLEKEVVDLESSDSLQDERLNNMDVEISDNENDIEALDDITDGLTLQVSDLEDQNILQDERISSVENDVTELGPRIDALEAQLENTNITALNVRVEALEELMSQMSGDISELQVTTADFETRIMELETTISEPWEACLSSPCDNDGTCVDVNVDTFICVCRDGYFGLTCAESFRDSIFFASLLAATSGSNPVVFNRDVINPGGHYNRFTGKYTAPYDGIYQFSVHTQDTSVTDLEMYIDDSQIGAHDDSVLSDERYRSTTVLYDLAAGQTVHVGTDTGATGSASDFESYFSGHLISAH